MSMQQLVLVYFGLGVLGIVFHVVYRLICRKPILAESLLIPVISLAFLVGGVMGLGVIQDHKDWVKLQHDHPKEARRIQQEQEKCDREKKDDPLPTPILDIPAPTPPPD